MTSTQSSPRSSSRSIGFTSHALLAALIASFLLLTQPVLAAAEEQPAAVPRPALQARQQQQQEQLGDHELAIFNYSSNYNYAGCYNDTNTLPGNQHALSQVIVGNGYLTAALCLEWCAHNGTAAIGRPYKFAGLEYSRECYCGETLNPLVVRLDDSACDTPCDGDNITACGGANKLSLYNITSSALNAASGGILARAEKGQGAAVLAMSGVLAVILGGFL